LPTAAYVIVDREVTDRPTLDRYKASLTASMILLGPVVAGGAAVVYNLAFGAALQRTLCGDPIAPLALCTVCNREDDIRLTRHAADGAVTVRAAADASRWADPLHGRGGTAHGTRLANDRLN
jgi:hypothetical protein